MRHLVLVGLAACGSSPAPAAPLHASAPHAAGPPALFAGLFAPKHEVHLPYEIRFDEDATARHGTATCWIEPVASTRGWAATVNCGSNTDDDGGTIADSLFGRVVATDAGLWWEPDKLPDVDHLDAATMLLAASPQAGSRQLPPGPDGRVDTRTVIAVEGGGWCARDERRPAPDGTDNCTVTRTLCFRDGALLGAALSACGVAYRVGAAPEPKVR